MRFERSDTAVRRCTNERVVYEVLRRSRTSGSVLQTALCYLEAIRAKVPELVNKRRSSLDALAKRSRLSVCRWLLPRNNSLLDTIHINPITLEVDSSFSVGFDADKVSLHKPKQSNAHLTPLSLLPSLLLCPRRTFLASLILASKFMQDRCYSNRA